MNDPDWWRNAAVYQIYPRSFADANGDGIGDLAGITSRIPYLRDLGIDAVWLSPFYPSALSDGGYDVDEYRDVDPRIGSLDDFDLIVSALHDAGLKIIVDIVPNHTSDRHAWFQEALAAGPGSPARDRYIFRGGKGEHGELPPADWQSKFGGPGWTRVPDGQWYLHTFAKEQPDLNWANREVRDDFLTTLAFWADRGVDGFRVDVAHYLTKAIPEVLPSWEELRSPGAYSEGFHPLVDRDEVHEIYAEWRALFNSYAPPRAAVAEAWVPAHRRVRYASPESLGQAFNFDLLSAGWDATEFRRIISDNLDLAARSGASSTWVFSSHDKVRHATRFGLGTRTNGKAWLLTGGTDPVEDRTLGLARARAATLLSLALPGSAYLYQGEELGLPEVAEIPDECRQDPAFYRNKGVEVGRDGCRVPLPWTPDGSSFGFGPGGAHLPQPAWFAGYAVTIQDNDPDSTLNLYRRALDLRSRLRTQESLEWLDLGPHVVAFRRPNGWTSITNFGDETVVFDGGEQLLSSSATSEDGIVEPSTTAWFAA
ncbi:glycoside hydrolase family 13 protein [Saccharopolyspora sp. NPDC002686]|uniref:glycoside hydrolase family 13 protein n=1 Tax=Saccharopolyspora sp. NPDC002686 TaxID=3154541 RepID=UPI0033335A49